MGILRDMVDLEAALWGRRAAIRREVVSYLIAGSCLWILIHQGPNPQVLAGLAMSISSGSWHWFAKKPLAPGDPQP